MDGLEKMLAARRALLRVVVVIAAVALVLVVMKSRPTSEADASSPIPSNPFANATVGDWATYVVAAIDNGRRADPEVFVSRVIAVDGDRVTTRLDTRTSGGKIIEGAARTFSKSRAPTVGELFAAPDSVIENVKLEREKRAFEGKKLACTRVTYDRRGLSDETGSAHVVARLCADVTGIGVVAVTATGADPRGNATTVVWELAGFGNGPKATLGRTLDEIPTGPVDMVAAPVR